jgi:hypothetical protein
LIDRVSRSFGRIPASVPRRRRICVPTDARAMSFTEAFKAIPQVRERKASCFHFLLYPFLHARASERAND